ncbi:MAG TPA: T9SS type A sorting domain-containing protein [Chitinophagales bacterium]|nr:T9SS type A sorting domain-containing protein [Chitinophagales bacterium]
MKAPILTVHKYAKQVLTFILLASSISFLNAKGGPTTNCAALNISVTNAKCNGAATGSITASASGGTAPYQYSINGGHYGNSGSFNNLSSGTYIVTVKDHKNCVTTSEPIYVGEPQAITPDVRQGAISCYGDSTAYIHISAGEGRSYTYQLNGGNVSYTGSFNNLRAGNYTIAITDYNGCITNVQFSITQPPLLQASNSQTNITCSGSVNGSVTVNGSGGIPPYSYNINSGSYQSSGVFSGLDLGTYTFGVMDSNGCTASTSATIINAPATACSLGYPDNSNLPRSGVAFNESDVLVASDPSSVTSCPVYTNEIKLWYNDEHAMTLGVRRVIVKTRSGTTTTDYPFSPSSATPSCISYPLVGTTIASGEQSGNDLAAGGGRPLWPALFITDITDNPGNRSGDWQQGGVGIAPSRVCGLWKAAVRTVDETKNPVQVTVTPDADPTPKNQWNLGGGDTPPGGFSGLPNEGYGAEVVWNVNDLNLISGHTYHLQFMVHDGDQNKSGGDVGEACTTIYIQNQFGSGKTDGNYSSQVATQPDNDGDFNASVYPNPVYNLLHVNIHSGSSEPISLKLIDILGQTIMQKENISNDYYLETGNTLTAGIYFVEIHQGSNTKVIRINKQN